ncbi:hypothetical protein QQP08_000301 [Theobroma cacao]|nr:hypothetical protein QQP08_000301 [Theobroma cacao]
MDVMMGVGDWKFNLLGSFILVLCFETPIQVEAYRSAFNGKGTCLPRDKQGMASTVLDQESNGGYDISK